MRPPTQAFDTFIWEGFGMGDEQIGRPLAIVKSTGQRVLGTIADPNQALEVGRRLSDFDLQLLHDQPVSHAETIQAALDAVRAEQNRRGRRPVGPAL